MKSKSKCQSNGPPRMESGVSHCLCSEGQPHRALQLAARHSPSRPDRNPESPAQKPLDSGTARPQAGLLPGGWGCEHLPRHLWRGPEHTNGAARPQPRPGRASPTLSKSPSPPAALVNSHFSNRLHRGDSELGLQLHSRAKANTLLGEAQLCLQLINALFQNNESLV